MLFDYLIKTKTFIKHFSVEKIEKLLSFSLSMVDQNLFYYW